MEKKTFEKAGLKIDADRVLTYSELPEEVRSIMLGCDTEFFQHRDDALIVLERLVSLNKDLSVITKLHLDKDYVRKVGDIDRLMRSRGHRLAFSISIPCFSSFKRWEPKAPDPKKRIESLRYAYEENILTMVAVRPLIPTVTDFELRDIIEQTADIAQGYYSGPLYLKNIGSGLLSASESVGLKVEKIQPHWMLEGNEFYRIEKPGQMEHLRRLLKERGKPLFEGAAEGIERLR